MYPRKSSEGEDKQVASIPDQIEELAKLASDAKLEVLEVLPEAQSAKAPGRPVFNEMIRRIYNGEARGIICWKLDRLARNPVDGGTINWMLQQGIIQHIKTYERSYYPTDNVLMMSVEFGMANQFVRDLSVNVKRGLRHKANLGWLPGVAPAGYLNTPDRAKGYKVVVKDPERFPLVRRMWDLMLTGNYTVSKILKIANKEMRYRTVQRRKEGGQPLSRSALYKMFTNPFYYGYFEYPEKSGNWVKGSHDWMITVEEYQRVQSILHKRGKPAPKQHLFAFTGLMKCTTCGCSVTAETKTKRQKNGNVHEYIYYHCTKKRDNKPCFEKSIELKELTRQIDGVLAGISISEKFKDWAIKHLHEVRISEAKTHEVAFQNKQKELESIASQLNSLMLKYTSPANTDGQLLSNEEYQALKTQLTQKKQGLELGVKAKGQEMDEWVELSERTFNFARYARLWFGNGDLDTKRAIVSCLGSNLLVKDGKLNIQLHPMFQTIAVNLPKAEQEMVLARTSYETQNSAQNLAKKGKTPALADACPSLLRERDSNPRLSP